jgi:hypothetical protein
MSSHFLGCGLYAFAAHNTTDTTHYEQHNVIEHLGKRLVHGSHRLQRLNHIGQAVEHERYDAGQNKCYNNYNETPDTGLKFFSGQTTLWVLMVGQFVSPIQGLRGNLGSLV